MGMLVSDSLQFEDLAQAVAEEGRSEFMVVGLPLRSWAAPARPGTRSRSSDRRARRYEARPGQRAMPRRDTSSPARMTSNWPSWGSPRTPRGRAGSLRGGQAGGWVRASKLARDELGQLWPGSRGTRCQPFRDRSEIAPSESRQALLRGRDRDGSRVARPACGSRMGDASEATDMPGSAGGCTWFRFGAELPKRFLAVPPSRRGCLSSSKSRVASSRAATASSSRPASLSTSWRSTQALPVSFSIPVGSASSTASSERRSALVERCLGEPASSPSRRAKASV